MAAYRNDAYPKLDESKYDANFVAFLMKEGVGSEVAEKVSADLGIKMTVCTLSLNSRKDTEGLSLSPEDRININTLILLVMRYQMKHLQQLWHVWYDSDMATCLQHFGVDVATARVRASVVVARDLRVLGIVGLKDLGRLTRNVLEEDMQWADTTKELIWRLRTMVSRFPDKRADGQAVGSGGLGSECVLGCACVRCKLEQLARLGGC